MCKNTLWLTVKRPADRTVRGEQDEEFEEREAAKADMFARRSKALVELLAAGEDLPRKIAVYRTVIDHELLLMLDDRIETAKE